MDVIEFLTCRLVFTGFPYGELVSAVERAQRSGSWTDAFLTSARQLHQAASEAENAKNDQTAAEMWRWVACAYHAASFGFHLETGRKDWARRVSRLRHAARLAYRRSLLLRPSWGTSVIVRCGGERTQGYLRTATPNSPLVVLVNGLDSIAEVELHCFADWLGSRGLATLALDLPARAFGVCRAPNSRLEDIW